MARTATDGCSIWLSGSKPAWRMDKCSCFILCSTRTEAWQWTDYSSKQPLVQCIAYESVMNRKKMANVVNDEVKRAFAPHTLPTHRITFGHEYVKTGSLVHHKLHRWCTITAYWYERQLQISCNEPSGSIKGEEVSQLAALLLASQGLFHGVGRCDRCEWGQLRTDMSMLFGRGVKNALP